MTEATNAAPKDKLEALFASHLATVAAMSTLANAISMTTGGLVKIVTENREQSVDYAEQALAALKAYSEQYDDIMKSLRTVAELFGEQPKER